MNAQALASLVARSTSFGQFLPSYSLSRVPRLMSMAGLLVASLLLAASPIRAQQEWSGGQQVSPREFLTASQEFAELYKRYLQDGVLYYWEEQRLRVRMIRLREIVDALLCGASYDYFDLDGRQTLHKGPPPECRLITTKIGVLPWNIVLPPVEPDESTTPDDESTTPDDESTTPDDENTVASVGGTVETSEQQQQEPREQPTEETEQVVVGLHPQTLVKTSGDDQQGPADTALDEPFVVAVRDQNGDLLEGTQVTFSVTAGGGMLSAIADANPCIFKSAKSSITAITDANGQATTRLTLGSEPRTNTVEITVAGLEPETFTATATEQAMPHSLAKVCGEDQEGTAGELLAEPFVVLVSDKDGAAMAGVAVTFAVTAGGGTFWATTDTTNATGRARTWLTLGSELGTNTVEATVEGLESVTFTATGQEDPLASLLDAFLGRGKRMALSDSPQLAQNAPNPFNSQTVLSYFLPIAGPAHLAVFSLTGQRVAVLHQGQQQAGYHRLRWNGRDDAGRPVASGIYLYRLVTDEGILTRKLTLLR